MKEFVPLIFSLVCQRHPTWQVHMNMGSLMGIWAKWQSFQSTCKSTLRIEVPVWPEVHQAVLPTTQVKHHPGRRGATSPAPPDRTHKQGVAPSLHGQDNTTVESPGERRRWRTCMCRRWGKDASLSSKASCSERRTLTLQDPLATNVK